MLLEVGNLSYQSRLRYVHVLTQINEAKLRWVIRVIYLLQIGYNNGVPIDEDFFVKNIAGGHNEDIASRLFPDWDHEKAMKFMDDKEEYFRK